MRREKFLAWGVHLYTATGLAAAALIAVLIVHGGDDSFRAAFALMLIATFIDSTDGWLARRARVKEVVPNFDGRTLDDIVDFQTYTSLPLLLIWRAEILPGGLSWWLLLPLLASAYGFSQVKAKTDDGFFLGFPSYWNVVAFYLYILRPPASVSLALVVGLSVLTFVPSRYLYLSQRAPFNRLTTLLAATWGVLLLMIIARVTDDSRPLVLVSLTFPVYYMLMSWALTVQYSRRGKDQSLEQSSGQNSVTEVPSISHR
ncbi:MAG TPA: CDP-alcohol phosphatidyltransferase family protein [Pyrinomonadaceae bacterium]|nr:CDP-alcohol phosphatidyltransferase family protein [Pyrinomonadaceae bacterium]